MLRLMRRGPEKARGKELLLWVAAPLFLVAALPALLGSNDSQAQSLAAELSGGLFAAQLAVVTFILVFSVDTSLDWPSLRTVLRRSGLEIWLVAGFLAFSLFAFLDDQAEKSILLGLCIAVVVSGFIPIKYLLDLSSASGREELLSSELSNRIKKGASEHLRDDLRPFIEVFQSNLNERGLVSLDSLVEQIVASYPHRKTLEEPSGTASTHLHLWAIERIAAAVFTAEIQSPSATEMIERLTKSLCSVTIGEVNSIEGYSLDSTAQIECACVLGATERFLAWTMRASARQAEELEGMGGSPPPNDPFRFRALFDSAAESRRLVARSVDPNPPHDFVGPDDGSLSFGLSNPRAGLMWWLASVDENGTGAGVYEVADILTGGLIENGASGSFGWDYHSVLGSVQHCLYSSESSVDSKGGLGESRNDVKGESRKLLEQYEGLGTIAGEALAISLSTWERFGTLRPFNPRGGWAYGADQRRLARRLRIFSLGPPEFEWTQDGITAAIKRIARLTGTDRPDKSISSFTFRAMTESFSHSASALPGGGAGLVFPPLVPLSARPGAVVLAVLIQSIDFSGKACLDHGFLSRVIAELPGPLLSECHELASRILPAGRVKCGSIGRGFEGADLLQRLEVVAEDEQGEVASGWI